jgi:hypothetical protein
MEARKLAESEVTPIQLSLRIRHPAMDPQEISAVLEMAAEHSFKAGESRARRKGGHDSGHHTQTYWLAPVTAESWREPIEPAFLAAIAERNPQYTSAVSPEAWQKAARSLSERNVEVVLLYFLKRLSPHQAFLQRIQGEGGDVAVIMLIERDSSADFALPPAVAGLLVQLGISIEFRFA